MTMPPAPSEIFDRRLRRARRDRAAAGFDDHAFLHRRMTDELIERLGLVNREFSTALDLGCADGDVARQLRARGIACVTADAGFRFAAHCGGVQCDEDRLPFADATFDLVMSVGVLDSVNDLPGALALIRRILKPDGLFLGAFLGAGSLPRLRAAMAAADGDRAAPRIHPQIDVRGAGDLLMRAGFAMPVADGERVAVRYGSLIGLAGDLRGSGGTNLLHDRGPPLTRAQIATGLAAFARDAAPDGKVEEMVELVFLSGWSPSPDQPKPARRGSGTVSLADALKRKAE
jgi:SAM-dependent methyltransferase